MSAIYQSFSMIQGQTVDLRITVTDSDDAAVDLTGGTVRFVMGRSPESTTLDVDSNASPQTATVVLTTPASGILTVTMTDVVTAALLDDYYYECKFTDGTGSETVITRGWITVEPSLT